MLSGEHNVSPGYVGDWAGGVLICICNFDTSRVVPNVFSPNAIADGPFAYLELLDTYNMPWNFTSDQFGYVWMVVGSEGVFSLRN